MLKVNFKKNRSVVANFWGDKCWRLNGKAHREDGPAIEYSNGNIYWGLNGNLYSKEQYNKELIRRGLK